MTSETDNARYIRESRARWKAKGYVRIEVQVPERDIKRIKRIAQHLRVEYELDKNRPEEKTDG